MAALWIRFGHWRRKHRLRKMGVTVAFTDPDNPMRDWKPRTSRCKKRDAEGGAKCGRKWL